MKMNFFNQSIACRKTIVTKSRFIRSCGMAWAFALTAQIERKPMLSGGAAQVKG